MFSAHDTVVDMYFGYEFAERSLPCYKNYFVFPLDTGKSWDVSFEISGMEDSLLCSYKAMITKDERLFSAEKLFDKVYTIVHPDCMSGGEVLDIIRFCPKVGIIRRETIYNYTIKYQDWRLLEYEIK